MTDGSSGDPTGSPVANASDEATEAASDSPRPRAPEPPPSLARGTAVGRYIVLSRLGAGGMGVVYLAYDPELDRHVAIKLLHPDDGRTKGQARARLLREAQALAKLAHPNVVAVYDAGEHEGEVWLAMELIEGQTLGAWCTQARPRWPERLRVLLDAGRGVAAAHAAGLVHRDLKPSNVMVATDGRVRVMDFGLARARGTHEPGSSGSGSGSGPSETGPAARGAQTGPAAPDAERQAEPSPSGRLDAPLTRTRDVLGTPAYMAPEQWDGAALDARADQFAWCVMAWEALYGQRPFGDRPMAVLTAARILEPPRVGPGGRVPRWVRRVLERGLAREPSRRFDGMEALLRVADRLRGRRRLQKITALLSGVLVVGVTGDGLRRLDRAQREQSCVEVGAQIATLWPGRAATFSQALHDSDVVYARWLDPTLTARFDDWAEQWQRTRTEVCQATLTGTLAEPYASKAVLCLQVQRQATAMLVDLVIRGDEAVLRRAPFMSTMLSSVATCQDRERLDTLPIPSPTSLATLRTAPERWLQAATLRDAGRYEEAFEQAMILVDVAQRTDVTPLLVQAQLLVGMLHADLGRHPQAEQALRHAYFVAGSAGHSWVAASAAAELVEVVGVSLARPEEGLLWGEHARMMMTRQRTRTDESQLRLLDAEAKIHLQQGRLERAQPMFERSLALRRRTLGPDHPEVGLALRNLAGLHLASGAYAEAAQLDRQALELLEHAVGPDHPEVAKTREHLATAMRGPAAPATPED